MNEPITMTGDCVSGLDFVPGSHSITAKMPTPAQHSARRTPRSGLACRLP
ncbi:hypothetical protein [Propionibacterium cyclohexanicum]|nr:hypothetical protein [Propionibacterium cyclohexanicum]